MGNLSKKRVVCGDKNGWQAGGFEGGGCEN